MVQSPTVLGRAYHSPATAQAFFLFFFLGRPSDSLSSFEFLRISEKDMTKGFYDKLPTLALMTLIMTLPQSVLV